MFQCQATAVVGLAPQVEASWPSWQSPSQSSPPNDTFDLQIYYFGRRPHFQCTQLPKQTSQIGQKTWYTSRFVACHPCAGAILIFSVSFPISSDDPRRESNRGLPNRGAAIRKDMATTKQDRLFWMSHRRVGWISEARGYPGKPHTSA